MDPSEQHDNTDDLERRLRAAFTAKALQISDADLDHDREDEVAAALSSQHRRHPGTRWFAGIGAAAAAAAIAGVTFVGLHGDDQRQVVNGLPPASTTASSSTSPSGATTSSPSSSSGGLETPLRHPAYQSKGPTTTLPTSGDSTASSAPRSETTTPPEATRTAMSGGSSTMSTPSSSADSSMSIAAHQPPAMPSGLPQSKALDDREYVGAVPLDDPSGGAKRMLSMPSETSWQRTAQGSNSLTVRLTYLPTDIEAYWRQTLPGQGWVADGAGWKFPGTSYAVSPINDKGSFTVTW